MRKEIKYHTVYITIVVVTYNVYLRNRNYKVRNELQNDKSSHITGYSFFFKLHSGIARFDCIHFLVAV